MSPKSLSREVLRPVLCLCEDLDTPRSLTVAILIRYGEWDQLVSLQIDPRLYIDSHSFFKDNLITELNRKNADVPTSFDRKAEAERNFWIAERQCYASNERLSPFLYGGLPPESERGVFEIIQRLRKMIATILGPVPLDLNGRFGPGSTFEDRGRLTTVPDKMSSHPTICPGAIGYLFPWSETAWARACATYNRGPSFVRGNRFLTVPKDAKKDRGIAVEPSINVYYQLALGGVIRNRLRRFGIDIQRGEPLHRRLAAEGSRFETLATIDLSNASDTVSYNLVKLLLPRKWFEALDSLRSPFTLVKGKWVRLEKFSSMGNGFTFELETLLFFAMSFVATESSGVEPIPGVNISTFGDDIIVPTAASKNVLAILKYFGFTPNARKTFIEGVFRESCGGDFFNGSAVRAHYLDSFPRRPDEYIKWANGFRATIEAYYGDSHMCPYFARTWHRILDAIPFNVRKLRGPEQLGDIVIHDKPSTWNLRVRNCIREVRVWKPVTPRRVHWHHFRAEVVLASALYGCGDGTSGSNRRDRHRLYGVIPRAPVAGHHEGWCVIP